MFHRHRTGSALETALLSVTIMLLLLAALSWFGGRQSAGFGDASAALDGGRDRHPAATAPESGPRSKDPTARPDAPGEGGGVTRTTPPKARGTGSSAPTTGTTPSPSGAADLPGLGLEEILPEKEAPPVDPARPAREAGGGPSSPRAIAAGPGTTPDAPAAATDGRAIAAGPGGANQPAGSSGSGTSPAARSIAAGAETPASPGAAPGSGAFAPPGLDLPAAEGNGTGARLSALLLGLERLRERAGTVGGTLTLEASQARELMQYAFGTTFPTGHVRGALIRADGRVTVRFDDGFSWYTPDGTKLFFGDNNDDHVLSGELYQEDGRRGIRIGSDQGLEAGRVGKDIERIWRDPDGTVWVEPLDKDPIRLE